jgi:hypothetical protein
MLQTKRLLRLADWLDRIQAKPPKLRTFNLGTWRRTGVYVPSKRDFCGTQCCAVGEAFLIPEFKALGFKYQGAAPAFGAARGWDAVKDFFGVSFNQAICLFSPVSYTNPFGRPGRVATRIRELVAQYVANKEAA